MTEKGKQFLLTLQPAEKIIENLKKHFFKLEAEIANTQKMLKQLNDQKITINYELGEEFNDVSSHFHASMSLLNGIDNKIKERDIAEKWKEKIYLEIRDLKNEFELEKEDVKSKWSEQQKTNALTHAKKIKETQIKIKTQEENTSEQLKNLKSMLSEITNILHENKAMEGNFYTESDSKNEHKNINWETEREIYSDNKDVAESKLLNQIKKENNNKKTHIFNSNQKLADHLKVQEEVKIFETIEIEKALENNFNLEKNEIYNDEIFEDVNIEEEFSIEENKDENKHLSQEILQEIKKYYQLTYFQHRGSLKLGFLMDYLGEEFSTDREDIKEKIRNLFRQKELELHPLEKLDNVDINNIICDGNISYHALTI